jgi:thioredoxin
MSIINVSDLSHFQQLLAASGSKLVVVDFTATWCGPCRQIAPVFEALASEYAGRATFLKVDVDAASDVSQFCSVTAMPTFHGYRQGSVVFNFSGADRSRLQEEVARNAPSLGAVSFSGTGRALADDGAPKVDWDAVSPVQRRAAVAAAAARRSGAAAPSSASTPSAATAAAAPKPAPPPPSKAAAAAVEALLAADEAAAAAAVSDARQAEDEAAADAAGAAAPDAPVPIQSGVNPAMLASLLEMGFPRPRAVRALHATFNKSAETAMEWCFEHSEDASKDAPLSALEDVVADTGAAAAAAAPTPNSQLTPEERQAKADELLARARERRAAEEKAAEIEREKNRVRQGKETTLARAKLEAAERKRAIEERRREKRAQVEERQRIRERIAADKAARMAKFNMPGAAEAAAAAEALAAPAPQAAAAPAAPSVPAGGKIQFRLPDGARIEGTFAADATVAQAAGFVARERPDLAASGFQLSSQYPKKVFTEADMMSTLAGAQLLPRGALNVSLL